MASIAPSTTQIQAHVGRLRRSPRWVAGLPVGIRSGVRWNGPDTFAVDGHAYEIAWCTGPLEVRDHLCRHDPSATARSGVGLVVVTPMDEHELGADVLARLAHGRLETLRAWDIVRDQFKAHTIDPQVTNQGWVADALLAAVAEGGVEPVPAGVLDARTAWRVLLAHHLGFRQHPPDLEGLLHWTRDGQGLARYAGLDDEFRSGVRRHLTETCGPAAAALLDCVDAGHGADAVPLGLACRVIFHPEVAGDPALAAAAVRLEKFTLDHPLTASAAGQWATAAESVVRQLHASHGGNAARGPLGRAEQLLVELKADAFAYVSDVLPEAYERRLVRYGERLATWIDSRSPGAASGLAAAATSVAAHGQARPQSDRLRRVEMSLRLVRYLDAVRPGPGAAATGPTPPPPFEELAIAYATDGGFADWARSVLAGEGQAVLADAFGRLTAAVTQDREAQNEHFALSLAAWTASASPARAVLPIEDVLAQVVAPLAAAGGPVLLVVLDGLSFAVYRELLEDLVGRHGWVQLAPAGQAVERPAVATVPSATTCSRASLLCGRLTRGGQSVEAEGFATHPALLAAGGNAGPPVLFHKAELSEAGGHDLSAELRRAIDSPRRVIGVVVNAVDDHLAKGEQVQPRWTLEYVRVLGPLLHEAALAGRYVVLASDHGHLLDRDTRAGVESELGGRWRPASPPPGPGELEVAGPRVLDGGGRLVAPWSEQIRYAKRAAGYHGGLSPQEMLAPLAVLSPPTGRPPEGWGEVATYVPAWWDPPSPRVQPDIAGPTVAPPQAEPSPVPRDRSRTEPATLFDPPPPVPAVTTPAPTVQPPDTARPTPAAGPAWLAALPDSPAYLAQKKLLARTPLSDATVSTALAALVARGGTMLRPALARQLNLPPLRVPGVIAALRRLLNVDGVDVLAVDDASDSVTLDAGRLRLQFDLE